MFGQNERVGGQCSCQSCFMAGYVQHRDVNRARCTPQVQRFQRMLCTQSKRMSIVCLNQLQHRVSGHAWNPMSWFTKPPPMHVLCHNGCKSIRHVYLDATQTRHSKCVDHPERKQRLSCVLVLVLCPGKPHCANQRYGQAKSMCCLQFWTRQYASTCCYNFLGGWDFLKALRFQRFISHLQVPTC